MSGKGDTPRPLGVDATTFAANWARTFGVSVVVSPRVPTDTVYVMDDAVYVPRGRTLLDSGGDVAAAVRRRLVERFTAALLVNEARAIRGTDKV